MCNIYFRTEEVYAPKRATASADKEKKTMCAFFAAYSTTVYAQTVKKKKAEGKIGDHGMKKSGSYALQSTPPPVAAAAYTGRNWEMHYIGGGGGERG